MTSKRRLITIVCATAILLSAGLSITAYSAESDISFLSSATAVAEQSCTISSLPEDIVNADIIYTTASREEKATSAKVTLTSGKAVVSNITESGFYTVRFYTETAETGCARIFVGQSGSIYSWKYAKETNSYEPDYTQENNVQYEEYEVKRLLDISGDKSIKVVNIEQDIATARVNVTTKDNYYGYYDISSLTTDDTDSCIISGFGKVYGDYAISFFSSDGEQVGKAIFCYKEDGMFIEESVYDEANNSWDIVYTPAEQISYSSNFDSSFGDFLADETDAYSFTISGTSGAVSSEIQYNTANWESGLTSAVVELNGDTSTISEAYPGFYTINFYDENNSIISYATFGITYDGSLIDFSENAIDEIICMPVETSIEFKSGNIGFTATNIPYESDTIEGIFLGDNTEMDKGVIFEPDYEYNEDDDTILFSGLGSNGNYYINFYLDGELQGYLNFCILNGKVYAYDSQYNDKTKEWESVMVESSSICFTERASINAADTYIYGDIPATFSNVPDVTAYSNFKYFGDDETYTTGKIFFPSANISGTMMAVSNLGQDGYYSVDLLNNNKFRVAQAFFCIEDGVVKSLKYNINLDLGKIEVSKTATSSIELNVFEVNTVEYEKGNISINITGIPSGTNHMSVSCSTSDGMYSSFEREISILDNNFKLEGLGMAGDYTATLYDRNNAITGFVRFFIDSSGKVFEVSYSYDNDNVEVKTLTETDTMAVTYFADASVNVLGDINFDEVIDKNDIELMKKYIFSDMIFSSYQFQQADLNGDGKVDMSDLIILKKKVLNS